MSLSCTFEFVFTFSRLCSFICILFLNVDFFKYVHTINIIIIANINLFQAQQSYAAAAHSAAQAIAHNGSAGQPGTVVISSGGMLYPSLGDYMGMQITQEMVSQNMQLVQRPTTRR